MVSCRPWRGTSDAIASILAHRQLFPTSMQSNALRKLFASSRAVSSCSRVKVCYSHIMRSALPKPSPPPTCRPLSSRGPYSPDGYIRGRPTVASLILTSWSHLLRLKLPPRYCAASASLLPDPKIALTKTTANTNGCCLGTISFSSRSSRISFTPLVSEAASALALQIFPRLGMATQKTRPLSLSWLLFTGLPPTNLSGCSLP